MPETACRILGIDRAVEDGLRALRIGFNQHRHQFAAVGQRKRPVADDRRRLLDQGLELGRGHLCHGVHDQPTEFEIVGHGDFQVDHLAEAARVDAVFTFAGGPGGPLGFAVVDRVDLVGVEDRVIGAEHVAIGKGHFARGIEVDAGGVHHVKVVGVERDADDAQVVQREQLAFVCFAVLIQIAPDLQVGPDRVGGVNHPVVVVVMARQLAKARPAGAAEHLVHVVDAVVAVLVHHQEPVVGPHPARLFGKAVAVEVEEAFRHLQRDEL